MIKDMILRIDFSGIKKTIVYVLLLKVVEFISILLLITYANYFVPLDSRFSPLYYALIMAFSFYFIFFYFLVSIFILIPVVAVGYFRPMKFLVPVTHLMVLLVYGSLVLLAANDVLKTIGGLWFSVIITSIINFRVALYLDKRFFKKGRSS